MLLETIVEYCYIGFMYVFMSPFLGLVVIYNAYLFQPYFNQYLCDPWLGQFSCIRYTFPVNKETATVNDMTYALWIGYVIMLSLLCLIIFVCSFISILFKCGRFFFPKD